MIKIAGICWLDNELTDCLAQECNINLRDYWTPTYDNTFKRLNVHQLLNIAATIYGAERVEQHKDDKKKEIAMALHAAYSGIGDVIERAKSFVPEIIHLAGIQSADSEEVNNDITLARQQVNENLSAFLQS